MNTYGDIVSKPKCTLNRTVLCKRENSISTLLHIYKLHLDANK